MFLNIPGTKDLKLRDFCPCGIILINVCVVIFVTVIMLLSDFGPNGIIFMILCVYCLTFSCPPRQ